MSIKINLSIQFAKSQLLYSKNFDYGGTRGISAVQQTSRRLSAPIQNQAQSLMQKLIAKIKWLLTKDGRPYLLVIALGFIIGVFVDGAVGVVLSTILGLALLTFLKKFHLPIKPWQATVTTLFPIVARLCFMMIMLIPVADAGVGLLLPSGHNPDTLMKYLSIMIVKPQNIISNAPASDVFPGIPIIVALSVVLMFWGSLNLYKRKNFLIAFFGLVLYTISPTIASAAVPTHAVLTSSYAAGYFLGWIGLVLIIVDRFFLRRILKIPTPKPISPTSQKTTALMSIMPFFAIALFLTQLHNIHLNFSIIQFQDFSTGFEEAHHAVASVLSGVVASVSAGVITTSVSSGDSGDSGNPPADQTSPPSAPTAPEPTTDTPPTTPPQQEPPDIDEINQAKQQQEINEKYMSDFQKDAQKSINDDKIKAANDDKALHDQQEHLHDETKKFWKDYYKDENEFNSWEAEHEISKAEGFEKLEHAAEYTKKGADWAIWVGKYTVPGGRTVADAYEATSEFAEGAAEGGFKQGLEKGGIKVGEKLLEHAMWHGLEHTLGHESDAGKFVHYINEEDHVHNLNDFAVEATKDKIKGLAPEQAGDWVKKKAGLEGEEGGHEGGEGGSEKGSEGSSGSESSEASSSAPSGSE